MDFCFFFANIGKNLSKNLSSKCNPLVLNTHQKRLHYAEQTTTDALEIA